MYFQNLSRRAEIGANSYLLDLGETRIVLDAGMHPKHEGQEALPLLESLPYDSIHSIILSHCHLDHVGSLPLLMRQQPSAQVYMTEACAELAEAMLHNSVNVMTAKRAELGMTEYPLFTHREVDRMRKQWEFRPLNKSFSLGDSDVECRFFDAGHIMGAVGVLLRHEGKRIFYTGDVNFEDQTLSKGAKFPCEPVDLLITETTRGAQDRRADYTRQSEMERFGRAIEQTLKRDGSVLIPVFAMGKTQEVLMMLHLLRQARLIRNAPILIGGLSTKMTVIYDKFADKIPRQHPGFELLEKMDLMVAGRRRDKDIHYDSGYIFALSSGMMTENTASNRFAFEFVNNPKNALLFVGYTDPESPGGKIRLAKKGDTVTIDSNKAPVELRCEIQEFDFSGHATRQDLRRFANELSPKKVLLVHGDPQAAAWFQEVLSGDLPGSEVLVPPPGQSIEF